MAITTNLKVEGTQYFISLDKNTPVATPNTGIPVADQSDPLVDNTYINTSINAEETAGSLITKISQLSHNAIYLKNKLANCITTSNIMTSSTGGTGTDTNVPSGALFDRTVTSLNDAITDICSIGDIIFSTNDSKDNFLLADGHTDIPSDSPLYDKYYNEIGLLVDSYDYPFTLPFDVNGNRLKTAKKTSLNASVLFTWESNNGSGTDIDVEINKSLYDNKNASCYDALFINNKYIYIIATTNNGSASTIRVNCMYIFEASNILTVPTLIKKVESSTVDGLYQGNFVSTTSIYPHLSLIPYKNKYIIATFQGVESSYPRPSLTKSYLPNPICIDTENNYRLKSFESLYSPIFSIKYDEYFGYYYVDTDGASFPKARFVYDDTPFFDNPKYIMLSTVSATSDLYFNYDNETNGLHIAFHPTSGNDTNYYYIIDKQNLTATKVDSVESFPQPYIGFDFYWSESHKSGIVDMCILYNAFMGFLFYRNDWTIYKGVGNIHIKRLVYMDMNCIHKTPHIIPPTTTVGNTYSLIRAYDNFNY